MPQQVGYRPGSPPLVQTPQERRTELAQDILNGAYLRGDFVLSSGARSTYYFDKYLFETRPTILRRLASLMAELVPAGVDRLAGPELGAVPLVTALSLETGLPFVIVRQAAKGYGTGRLVEGELHQGERLLIVEDVINSAAEALKAAATVVQAGAVPVGVLAVIDREQGGAENVAAAGYRLTALFRRGDLLV